MPCVLQTAKFAVFVKLLINPVLEESVAVIRPEAQHVRRVELRDPRLVPAGVELPDRDARAGLRGPAAESRRDLGGSVLKYESVCCNSDVTFLDVILT